MLPEAVWLKATNMALSHRLRKAERVIYALETKNAALEAALHELTEMENDHE